eukprot:scaffold1220_cov259-Pinguiococcus_pyrenoidosus.AAC.103
MLYFLPRLLYAHRYRQQLRTVTTALAHIDGGCPRRTRRGLATENSSLRNPRLYSVLRLLIRSIATKCLWRKASLKVSTTRRSVARWAADGWGASLCRFSREQNPSTVLATAHLLASEAPQKGVKVALEQLQPRLVPQDWMALQGPNQLYEKTTDETAHLL